MKRALLKTIAIGASLLISASALAESTDTFPSFYEAFQARAELLKPKLHAVPISDLTVVTIINFSEYSVNATLPTGQMVSLSRHTATQYKREHYMSPSAFILQNTQGVVFFNKAVNFQNIICVHVGSDGKFVVYDVNG